MATAPSNSDNICNASKMPHCAEIIKKMFRQMDIKDYEPQLILQLCDISYSLTKEILVEARSVSEFSGKKQVDRSDVDFAIKAFDEKHCKDRPSKTVISELAAEKNAHPLEPIRQNFGLRLPNDRFCQLQPNYVYIEDDPNNELIDGSPRQTESAKFSAMSNFNADSISSILMSDKRKRPYPNDEMEKPVQEEEDEDYD